MKTQTAKEALFTQLRDLTKSWGSQGKIPASQQNECKLIGAQLNELGGQSLMVEAYYYAKLHNRFVSVIQAYWDGIGDWRW